MELAKDVAARVGLLGLLTFGLAGCTQPVADRNEGLDKRGQLETLSESQQEQRKLAIAAKEELFQSLLGELTSSIQTNGVPKSIEICKTKAPELAKSVSHDQLRIGRTSFQLRNPKNVPPAWAVSFVEERVKVEVNVELGDNGLGVLLPIRLKSTCLLCHGSADSIMPEVATAIHSLYPDDKATGFSDGDLRGYFWIEVANQAKQ